MLLGNQAPQGSAASFQTRLDAVGVVESLPITLPSPPQGVEEQLARYHDYVTFLLASVTYLPPDPSFVGNDTFVVAVRDAQNVLSQQIRVEVEVLPSSCENDGVCGGSQDDPACQDLGARRRGFEGYNCSCLSGFEGERCEISLVMPDPPPARGETSLTINSK